MLRGFTKNLNSLSVCHTIVNSQKEIKEIRLIAHSVYTNWRQVHKSSIKKMRNLDSGFIHPKFESEITLSRKKFLLISQKELVSESNKIGDNIVWSITSKVNCNNNVKKHIPMMNFHPEGITKSKSIPYIMSAIKQVGSNKKGVLLDSGRYYHYYGNYLLEKEDWLKFMADFLMPCVLVSPRYIGHCINQGYAALRLSQGKNYKNNTPVVVKEF